MGAPVGPVGGWASPPPHPDPAAPHVGRAHTLTDASSDPDASILPSVEKATALTAQKWPSSVLRCSPVAGDHSRTVSSEDPDARSLPSGEKASALMTSPCPPRRCRSSPVAAEVSRMEVSMDPLAIAAPSGDTATQVTHPA